MRYTCAQDPDSAEDRVGQLIISCLEGDAAAREDLYRGFSGDMLKIARGIAPDLAEQQLDEDVVQQAFLHLFSRPPGHFDPGRGGAWAYLKVTVRLAARDVRAAHPSPGRPKRPEPNDSEQRAGGGSPTPPPPLSLDEVTDADLCRFAEEIEDWVIADLSVPWLIESVPAAAPAWLGRALALLAEGLTITQVSTALDDGVSRFAIRRAIDHWARPGAEQLRSTD